jgi:hypothetical protein
VCIGGCAATGSEGLDSETRAYNCIILLSLCVGLRGKNQSRNRFEYVLYLFYSAYDILSLQLDDLRPGQSGRHCRLDLWEAHPSHI